MLSSAAPKPAEISTSRLEWGLTAIEDAGEGITFQVGWPAEKFDKLFRTYLPKPMTYLDSLPSLPGGRKYRWCILSKSQQKLSVAVDGDALTSRSRVQDAVVGQGKKWSAKALYIGELQCCVEPGCRSLTNTT